MLAEQRVGTGFPDAHLEIRARVRDVDGVVAGFRDVPVTCHHRRRFGEGAHALFDGVVQRRGAGRRHGQQRDVEILVLVFVLVFMTVIMIMIVVVAMVVVVRMMIVLARGLE